MPPQLLIVAIAYIVKGRKNMESDYHLGLVMENLKSFLYNRGLLENEFWGITFTDLKGNGKQSVRALSEERYAEKW